MISPEQLFSEALVADSTAVQALIGDRAFELIAPKAFVNDVPAVIYHLETLPTDFAGAFHTGNFVVKCYGGSQKKTDAETVARAVYDRFHAKEITVASGSLGKSFVTQFQSLPPEPETGWAVYLVRVMCLIEGS